MCAQLSDIFSKSYVKDITPVLQAFSNIKQFIQHECKIGKFQSLSLEELQKAFVLMFHISTHHNCTYDSSKVVILDKEKSLNVNLIHEINSIKSSLYNTGIATADFFNMYKLLDNMYVYILESVDCAAMPVYLDYL
jgi:hypothetical protein